MLARWRGFAKGLIVALLISAPARGSDPETLAPSEVKAGVVYYVETKPIPAGYGLERSRTYEGVVLKSNADELVIEGNCGSFQNCTKPWLTNSVRFGFLQIVRTQGAEAGGEIPRRGRRDRVHSRRRAEKNPAKDGIRGKSLSPSADWHSPNRNLSPDGLPRFPHPAVGGLPICS